MSARSNLEAYARSRRIPEEANVLAWAALAVVDAVSGRPDPVAKFLDDLRLAEVAFCCRIEVRRKDGRWSASTFDGQAEASAESPAEALSVLSALASDREPPA